MRLPFCWGDDFDDPRLHAVLVDLVDESLEVAKLVHCLQHHVISTAALLDLRMHSELPPLHKLPWSAATARAGTTYRLEDRNLAAVPVMVGLDFLVIVAVQLRELRRHPLVSLVQIFARRRSQRRLVARIVVGGGWCLDRGHHLCGCRRSWRLHCWGGCYARRVWTRCGLVRLAGVVHVRKGDIRRSPRSAPGVLSGPHARYGCRMGVTVSQEVVSRRLVLGQAWERRPGSKVHVGEVRGPLGPVAALSVLAQKPNRPLITPWFHASWAIRFCVSIFDRCKVVVDVHLLDSTKKNSFFWSLCEQEPSSANFAVGRHVHARHVIPCTACWRRSRSSILSDQTPQAQHLKHYSPDRHCTPIEHPLASISPDALSDSMRRSVYQERTQLANYSTIAG